jgi:glycosyltransferase involved in cell wall biosynthesis
LAKELNLSNVDFLGFVSQSEQRKVWSRTAFSVIPSVWSEPFPLTFLESWSNGRTFVANRLGAMAEVVQENVDGLLSEPFSPESLAQQIQRMMDDPDRCAAMGRAGYRRIREEFDQAQWLSRMNHVLETSLSLR